MMVVAHYNDVLKLARSLPRDEQIALAERLLTNTSSDIGDVTLQDIQTEFERRKASGLFKSNESLYGKFAHPDHDHDYDLLADLHAISTEWEAELDEFDDSQS